MTTFSVEGPVAPLWKKLAGEVWRYGVGGRTEMGDRPRCCWQTHRVGIWSWSKGYLERLFTFTLTGDEAKETAEAGTQEPWQGVLHEPVRTG